MNLDAIGSAYYGGTNSNQNNNTSLDAIGQAYYGKPSQQAAQEQKSQQPQNWFQNAVDAVASTVTSKLKELFPQQPIQSPVPKDQMVQQPQNESLLQKAEDIGSNFINKPLPFASNTGNVIDSFISSNLFPPVKDALSQIISDPNITKIKPSDIFGLNNISLQPTDIRKAVLDGWNSISKTVTQEAPKIKAYFDSNLPIGLNLPNPSPQAIGKNLEAVSAAGNIAFSPISALFSAANDIPSLSVISKLITAPFTIAGESASNLSGEIVDKLPIPQKAKDQIKPGLTEIAALAAQLALGKATEISATKHTELVKKFGEQDAATIEQKAQEIAQQKKQATNTTPQNVVLNPDEARVQATATDITGTNAEVVMRKAADMAEAQGKDIQVNLNSSNGEFTSETPKGTKFSLELVDKKQITQVDENGKQVQQTPQSTQDNTETATNQPKNTEPTDEQLIANYRKQFEDHKLLNTDNVREVYTPQGYMRINSADFHDRASMLSDKIFEQDLNKLQPGDNYLFTAGASGAGKSTGFDLNPSLVDNVKAGLDGNFSSNSSLKKLDQVIEKGAKPTILFTYRDPLDAWNNGVVRRAINPKNGRVVPLDVFLKNLERSPEKVLEAYKKYGDKVDIQVVDNSHGKGNARLVDNPIEFLQKIHYNISDVKDQILKTTEERVQTGEIKPEVAKALFGERLGAASSRQPEQERQGEQSSTVNSTESPKKPSYNSAQSRAIQASFADTIDSIQKTSTNQEDLVKGIDEAVGKAEALAKGDKTVLAGIRTALNKMMLDFAGHSGDYKRDYAILQSLKDDPLLGDTIKTLEGHINRISEDMLKPSPELTPQVDNTKKVDTTGTGETKTSKLSLGVEQKAIAEKLTRSLGDLPEFKRTDMNEQGRLAIELLKNDEAKATRIALGQEVPPAELLPESVFTAVEDKALTDGNVALIKELAKSSLSSEATVMGKRIAALAQRNPDSPVTAIKDLADTRAKALEKRTGKTVNKAISDMTKQIKDELKKTAPKKEDWRSFVKGLQC